MKRRTRWSLIVLLGSMACVFCSHASQLLVTDDFNFGTWSPLMSRWKKTVPVCVWDQENGFSVFRISASGMNSSADFELVNDIQEKVPYKVRWRSGFLLTRSERLRSNQASRSIYLSSDRQRCQNGATGNLEVSIDKSVMENAVPGVYSDTLLVMIRPI